MNIKITPVPKAVSATVSRTIQRFRRATTVRAPGRVSAPRRAVAFTLVELLVVIAIIAILAAMLLPVFSVAITHAKKTKAKLECNQIANAIEQYDSRYSRMPVSSYVQQSGSNNVTYGGIYNSSSAVWPSLGTGWGSGLGGFTTPVGLYITNNSDVMAILLNLTNYPNSSTFTVNTNYQKNPMQTVFLSASFSSDTRSPGIGTDLNYRDPWGNPYIITMDLNEDNKAEDPFYSPITMSSSTGAPGGAGFNGLSAYDPDGIGPDTKYIFHGNVMVWSMGPNGLLNQSPSSFTYNLGTADPDGHGWVQDGSNKNHILSWAQ
ncbi:MAG: prepilin-type N-terminal cleavage/methylation domain-containing protein [Limisphaerales bacterium]